MEVVGPHKVCTPCLEIHLTLSSYKTCSEHKSTCSLTGTFMFLTTKLRTMKHSCTVLSPRQAVATHSVAGGRAVALLEAIDECTVQTGLALLQAPVLFEATASAGHAPGIFSIAKATFLEGLMVKIHRVRGGVCWFGAMCRW